MKKKFKLHPILISLLALLLVSGFVVAADVIDRLTSIDNVETMNVTYNISSPNEEIINEDFVLGGAFSEDSSTTATSSTQVAYTYGYGVFDTFRWGDHPTINQNSETTHYVQNLKLGK